MPEFLNLKPPQEALETLFTHLSVSERGEAILVEDALGRVVFEPVKAGHPLPSFRRSTVDGFAVLAEDTYGASESLPAYMPLAGEVPMGAAPDFPLEKGTCAVIHTGGMLPEGANAVVMIEYTQQARENEVEILRTVAVGENVLQVGEDVQTGALVIPAGTRIRPAEIGGMMALGVTEVSVAARPRVGIISSGDEVVHPSEEIGPGRVRDVNSYTLQALVRQAGGEPVLYGIAPDQREAMAEIVGKAHRETDLVVVTAGSSASARDLTSMVIDSLGEPGVLVHGVNVRPGKPTILGVCNGKPVIGLPGNPVSALVIAGLFVVPLIERMLGLDSAGFRPVVQASLKVNLASQAGREDWVAVRLEETEKGLAADPIFGKSNLIFTLARADGLVKIPADANGIAAGSPVQVWMM
ncbi:MAG: molybdopterin-binding protein [Anaerolineales bacterium]